MFESVGQRLEQCWGYDEEWKEKIDGDIIEGDRHQEAGQMDDDITEDEVRVVVQRLRNESGRCRWSDRKVVEGRRQLDDHVVMGAV